MSSMKLSGLTGLRWLASLWVLLYHTNQLRSVESLPDLTWNLYLFIQASMVAVSFFFLIGGIYRSIPYWESILHGAPFPGFKQSVIHRILRITPAYYVALIASFVIAWMLGRLGEHAFIQLLGGITFLSWIHPILYLPVEMNGPLWFIPYDMAGTLLVILLMTILSKIRKKYIPLGIGMSAIALIILHYLFTSIPFPIVDGPAGVLFPWYNPFYFGLHFLFGIILCGVFVATGDQTKKQHWRYDLSAIMSLIILSVFFWHMREAWDLDGSWPKWPYFFPTVQILISILIVSLARSVRIGKWLDNPFFSWVAKISYGMYLWHMIVVVLLSTYLFHVELRPPTNMLHLKEWAILLGLSLPISLGVSYMSWRWIESWLGGWVKKRFEK